MKVLAFKAMVAAIDPGLSYTPVFLTAIFTVLSDESQFWA